MAETYVIDAPATPSIPVVGQKGRFPVHRIYCVGRNYAAHAREMGKDPEKEPPFFFLKPADAVLPEGGQMHYPPGTANLHHEIELVVAIQRGGFQIPAAKALDHVYGYAVGLDMTRRDLQIQARDMGRPWDFGKAFDESAPITAIYPGGEPRPSLGRQDHADGQRRAAPDRGPAGHDLEHPGHHRLPVQLLPAAAWRSHLHRARRRGWARSSRAMCWSARWKGWPS